MNCPKCQRVIPDDAVICCYCGKKLQSGPAKRKQTKRPNGTGNVYQRGSTWTARVVDHYVDAPGTASGLRPVWKTKGGFKTKRDAINYLPTLCATKINEHPPKSFKENFDEWKVLNEDRVGKSTMAGYKSAFEHFKPIHQFKINTISVSQMQECINKCGKGKRTKQLMKVVAGLIFKHAIGDKQIESSIVGSLWTGNDQTEHYAPLTDDDIKKIEESGLPYADYVVAMCYLGHRPVELFGFTKSDLHCEENEDTKEKVYYITGGAKTEAGKGRAVPVPKKIMPIIEKQAANEDTDFLFPRRDFNRKGEPIGYSQMPVGYFREYVWKPMMEKLGIEGRVPYATRHTYAGKIKHLDGTDKDKAALMGHTEYDVTQKHYQTTTLEELKAITDQIK